jgi:HEAT repeat protein
VASAEQGRIREQIRKRFEELRGRDLTNAEVDVEVEHLLTFGDAAIPVILEQFKDDDETLLAVATQALKSWGEPRPVESLLALLRNTDVGDLSKALILNVLEKYGLDVDDPETLGLSIDLEDYQVDSSGNGGDGARDP